MYRARHSIHLLAMALMVASVGTLGSCDSDDLGLPERAAAGYDESGATNAVFTVSSSRKVHFSRGNLQYRPSTGQWRLAEHQYDCIGDANRNIGDNYDGWIDLFGWGTSGWASGAVAYRPTDTSTLASDYMPGGVDTTGLYGDQAQADWGRHNRVGESSMVGEWRTLTGDEWHYLLELRTEGPDLRGFATIDGTYRGLIVVPDGWKRPSGISFKPDVSSFNANRYTADEWATLEASGAVFLTAAGQRFGTSLSGVGSMGLYWSSSPYDEGGACNVTFSSQGLGAVYGHNRHCGYSVRLVKD